MKHPLRDWLVLGLTLEVLLVVSHSRDLVLAGNVETTPETPSVTLANAQATPAETHGMDGDQLIQWLTVQVGDVTCMLQQGVRAPLSQASASLLELRDHVDDLARLKAQLQYQKRFNHEIKAMLHTQALAMDAFQHQWRMAGSEAQAFIQ